ncbi:hypothetical protein [Photobacterium nomapromontoriensis]|uniref:hypothetical protein n=1 Tax=Photobacterium nomapromontoriensis TaxID=2910237 RepID=UPI003D0C918B
MSNESWLEVLRKQCQPPRSQRIVATELGVSATQVNQVLKGNYKGDLARICKLVEGRYMNQVVICPVLGELSVDKCQCHQEREFAATNPQRVMLYKVCRSGCPHSHLPVTIKIEKKLTGTNPFPPKDKEWSGEGKVIFYQSSSNENKNAETKRKHRNTKGENLYSLESQLAYFHRIAGGDALKLSELLETELTKLATRYNQLLWSKKYSRSEK